MRFNPTEKAKALLRDWHQMCQDDESNAQPAWNKVRLPPGLLMQGFLCAEALPQSQCPDGCTYRSCKHAQEVGCARVVNCGVHSVLKH